MQTAEQIARLVNTAYSAKASDATNPAQADYFRKVAAAFGYTDDQLALLDGANMGLGCGNPSATANIKAGETVVDLGCGGGMDIILASAQVGETGKVWGIDMNKDMIELAEKNIKKRGINNIELVSSSITDLSSIPSGSVDCIISNCVINLVPDEQKPLVLREAYRILKPGGRLAISDIVMKQDMPDDLKKDALALVGCVAGAVSTEIYKKMLSDEGFKELVLLQTSADLNVYFADASSASCCSSGCSKPSSATSKYDINEYAGSCQIFAIKPMA